MAVKRVRDYVRAFDPGAAYIFCPAAGHNWRHRGGYQGIAERCVYGGY